MYARIDDGDDWRRMTDGCLRQPHCRELLAVGLLPVHYVPPPHTAGDSTDMYILAAAITERDGKTLTSLRMIRTTYINSYMVRSKSLLLHALLTIKLATVRPIARSRELWYVRFTQSSGRPHLFPRTQQHL